MITIPTLETERMILRGPKPDDFEPFAKFLTTERSAGIGGPASRSEAWRGMAMMIGHWELRGYGMWWLEERASGRAVGRVGLWNPEGWPALELGWVVYDGFEGRGYAYEAAVASRDYARKTMPSNTLISLIAPENARSIRLAERLGATRSGTWASPAGKEALIYTHPEPEAKA
jgi:RimJ/RimL family protein N-acetyltransferase